MPKTIKNKKKIAGAKAPAKAKSKTKTKSKSHGKGPIVDHRFEHLGTKLGLMGGAYMGPIGAAVGTVLGSTAGGLIDRITGHGDYKVSRNSLHGAQAPAFSARDTIRVRRTEFVTDVKTPGATFNNTSYMITPENVILFPWLAGIARNFSQYELHGLVFMFKSTSATAIGSTNTALGKVIMATNYDPDDDEYIDMKTAENSAYCTSSKPAENQLHPIECARSSDALDTLYINNDDIDPRFSSYGRFQICTAGQQAAATIGELWVSYDISFKKAHVSQINPSAPIYGHWFADNPTDSTELLIDATGSSAGTSTAFELQTDGGILFRKSGRYMMLATTQSTGASPKGIAAPVMGANFTSVLQFWDYTSSGSRYVCNPAHKVSFRVIDVLATHEGGAANTLYPGVITYDAYTNGDVMIMEIPRGLGRKIPTRDSLLKALCLKNGVHFPVFKMVTNTDHSDEKAQELQPLALTCGPLTPTPPTPAPPRPATPRICKTPHGFQLL